MAGSQPAPVLLYSPELRELASACIIDPKSQEELLKVEGFYFKQFLSTQKSALLWGKSTASIWDIDQKMSLRNIPLWLYNIASPCLAFDDQIICGPSPSARGCVGPGPDSSKLRFGSLRTGAVARFQIEHMCTTAPDECTLVCAKNFDQEPGVPQPCEIYMIKLC
ncbi:hypothetical protein WJX73_003202 [Symbiochloris irregularis]|uniref:Uncharacterized protein n=1 Tax=Symbiochloris irregularis TaxID=706552 RepID=A0AAW1P7K2_9CHLO